MDGVLLEMVFREAEKKTLFAVWDGESVRYEPSFPLGGKRVAAPYSPDNNLVKNHVILFPASAEEYGSEQELIQQVQAFIHRYVDVSPIFEKIATYYVLLSWLYDSFNELPYLRVRADYGSGKTRFLLIVGSLCYRPIFATGASTVSPLFRIIDSFGGTLVVDEGDFRFSDEKAEMVKILNSGNSRGFPVLRSELAANRREFNPTAYNVFGPKIVATRGFFEDKALESRCITEEMGQFKLREDIPINLPPTQKEEALQIRNKLLLFRFRNLKKRSVTEDLMDRALEPRLNQIFMPLLSVIEDAPTRAELADMARRVNSEHVAERGTDAEGQVLEIIRDVLSVSPSGRLPVKDITSWFVDRHGEEYERKVTTRWIGSIIRKKLGLKTQKSNGVFVIPPEERPKLPRLYEKFGLGCTEAEHIDPPTLDPARRVDIGDVGDIAWGVTAE